MKEVAVGSAAVGNAAVPATQIIDIDAYAAYVEVSTITEVTDLGSSQIIKAIHPELGGIILVNTNGEKNAIIYQ